MAVTLLLEAEGTRLPGNGNWEFRFSTAGAVSGVLQARPSTTSQWGIVCDDFFNVVAAKAACRSLGLPIAGATFGVSSAADLAQASVNGSTLVYMDDVTCNRAGEPYLPQCTFLYSDAWTRTHNCHFTEAVYVLCAETNWQVSLARGTTAYNGLLRVRPDTSSDWGIVCDDYFGVLEAQAACRSIFGTNFSAAASQTSTAAQRLGYATASTTIYMDDVVCNSGQHLLECNFIESTPTARRNDCDVSEAVYLICTAPATTSAPTPTTGAPTPTTGAPTPTTGASTPTTSAPTPTTAASTPTTGAPTPTTGAPTPTTGAPTPTTGVPTPTTGVPTPTTGAPTPPSSTLPPPNSTLFATNLPTGNGNWQFRFPAVGATSGILQVRPNATAPWGIVCHDYFDIPASQAACRSLGLPTAGATFSKPTSTDVALAGVSGATPIYMDDILCSGSEPYLPQCEYRTSHDCFYLDAAAVSCGSTPPPPGGPGTWQLRLKGGATAYEGLLMVRPASTADWGIVCDDGFGALEAQAACRFIYKMTFPYTSAETSTAAQRQSHPNATAATIYMDDVRCSSGQTLPQCTFIESTPTITRHNCSADRAVYVYCYRQVTSAPTTTSAPTMPSGRWQVSLVGGTTPYYGLLRVRPDANSDWGVVCDDGFDEIEAQAACRSILGSTFPDAIGQTSTDAQRLGYVTAATIIYMDDVRCLSGQRLPDCLFTESTPTVRRHNCAVSDAVYLDCAPSSTIQPPAIANNSGLVRNGNWQFQLPTAGARSGVLLVRPNATAPWGVVCRDRFNDAALHAACRSLGFPSEGAFFGTPFSADLTQASVDINTIIYMDDVNCDGAGPDAHLPQCGYRFSDAGTTTHDCSYFEAVYVACSRTNTRDWEVSLAGGTTIYDGLLRVRPAGSSEWGIVCRDYFGPTEAQAACRSVFNTTFPDAIGQTSIDAQRLGYATAATTVYMDDVRCNSGQRLPECAFIESTPAVSRHNCAVYEAVYLICTAPTTIAPTTRLGGPVASAASATDALPGQPTTTMSTNGQGPQISGSGGTGPSTPSNYTPPPPPSATTTTTPTTLPSPADEGIAREAAAAGRADTDGSSGGGLSTTVLIIIAVAGGVFVVAVAVAVARRFRRMRRRLKVVNNPIGAKSAAPQRQDGTDLDVPQSHASSNSEAMTVINPLSITQFSSYGPDGMDLDVVCETLSDEEV